MAKKQVRDNSYYKKRLKNDHPKIDTDLEAGVYKTVTDAAIAAGLKKSRTRLLELKNAWSKATVPEQNDFLRWLAGAGVAIPTTLLPAVATSAFVPSTVDRRLTAIAAKRIGEIFAKRNLKMGDVMAEMGYSRLNPALGMALARQTQLNSDLISALEKWIAANASI